ncbi:MAG TPA: serine/threonine-protein kinase [Polyangia bacterium]|nr:serine/threonine-protein kinase [Polyangia bacterium]
MRRLGRFQIIGRLATGGMAEVYLALSGELPGFRTLLVVKRILPHLAQNRQFIRMFLDEARLAALLDHPNVVRIIEVGHDGEEYFLAMELVQGKPLSAVLRKAAREKRPPSPALAAYIMAQAASGLGYAHALTDGDGRPLGVVHRDVSPQNVLLSFEGAVKLIDFGVARAFGRVAHTSPGGLKGKIEYMSPEQASAEEVDHRADVFALGIVLWEVLTGRRLYRRETELATMRAILDDPIPRPSEVADVPIALEAVVMRALRKKREGRFSSAHEMAQALERYAFSQDGFSPVQLATYMKGLFASEFLQWRKTATSALDMEVDRGDQQPPRFESPGAEPMTQGPTMALRPSASISGFPVAAETRSATVSSHGARSRPAGTQTSPSAISGIEPPSKRDRLWVYGGLGALVAITCVGAWLLARPAPPIAPREPAPVAALPAPIASSPAPAPALPPPTADVSTPAPAPAVPPPAASAPPPVAAAAPPPESAASAAPIPAAGPAPVEGPAPPAAAASTPPAEPAHEPASVRSRPKARPKHHRARAEPASEKAEPATAERKPDPFE